VIGEPQFWNKGYGTEITYLMLRHAFGTLNLNRVSLRVFAENKPAIHVYEKIGFQREGCMREAEFRTNKYTDVLLYSILRREWEMAGAGKEK